MKNAEMTFTNPFGISREWGEEPVDVRLYSKGGLCKWNSSSVGYP